MRMPEYVISKANLVSISNKIKVLYLQIGKKVVYLQPAIMRLLIKYL